MTREEFNIRTNANASTEEFETINRVYMAAGDAIDKDQFCNDVKKSGITPTLESLADRVETMQELFEANKRYFDSTALFIAEQAEKYSSIELRNQAIAMMGVKKYLTWKIENEKNLWQVDLELIKDLINS
ncbi:MAG: hypothetical protein HUK14_06260 [Muribaculaceae bacterium]|nr:hypothetical protein [Muribaculaceae bacterium]